MNKTNIKKIEAVIYVSVKNANPNGSPSEDGRPRQDMDGYGMITDVCLRHKIRNFLIYNGYPVLYAGDDAARDGMTSVAQRVESLPDDPSLTLHDRLCKAYIDVRAFGAVAAYKKGDKAADKKARAKKKAEEGTEDAPDLGENTPESMSLKVRGPVSVSMATSICPVEVQEIQITKSLNGSLSDKGMTSDRMGWKYLVSHGLYRFTVTVNPILAEKTGLTEEDVEAIKKAIVGMFDNDESAARPAGSMVVEKVYWFTHPGVGSALSPAAVHRSIAVRPSKDEPKSADDYEFGENYTAVRNAGISLEVYVPETGWSKEF